MYLQGFELSFLAPERLDKKQAQRHYSSALWIHPGFHMQRQQSDSRQCLTGLHHYLNLDIKSMIIKILLSHYSDAIDTQKPISITSVSKRKG